MFSNGGTYVGQCNSLQAIINIHDVYTMYKNKWGVMVNTCKEFQLLPLSKGDTSIRDFAPPSGEEPSLTEGRIFSLEILYPDQQKRSSETLTEWQNVHFHLFLIREEPSLTEWPNVVHYN